MYGTHEKCKTVYRHKKVTEARHVPEKVIASLCSLKKI